jgi:hypothetical protein
VNVTAFPSEANAIPSWMIEDTDLILCRKPIICRGRVTRIRCVG